jgi:hypothetical protein
MMKVFPVTNLIGPDDHLGLDLRDYFAAKAMEALINNFLSKGLDEADPIGWMAGLSSDAYEMADKMLRARDE